MFLFCEQFLPGGSIDRPRGLVSVGLGTRIARRSSGTMERSEFVRNPSDLHTQTSQKPERADESRTQTHRKQTARPVGRSGLEKQEPTQGKFIVLSIFFGDMQDVGAPCERTRKDKLESKIKILRICHISHATLSTKPYKIYQTLKLTEMKKFRKSRINYYVESFTRFYHFQILKFPLKTSKPPLPPHPPPPKKIFFLKMAE